MCFVLIIDTRIMVTLIANSRFSTTTLVIITTVSVSTIDFRWTLAVLLRIVRLKVFELQG